MRFLQNRKIFFFFLGAAVLFFFTGLAFGARLSHVNVTHTRTHLRVNLKISGAFSPKIQKAVLSGVPTTFSFFIILEEKRNLWANKTVADITLTHTVKYSSLKKEFTVRRSWDGNRPITVKSPKEAESLMSEISGYLLTPLDRLEKGEDYRLQTKAKLSRMSLPLYLRMAPIMPSVWEFETEWHSIDFEY